MNILRRVRLARLFEALHLPLACGAGFWFGLVRVGLCVCVFVSLCLCLFVYVFVCLFVTRLLHLAQADGTRPRGQ